MVSKVCSRSQGQPPGARSRAMMDTARSKRSPVVGIRIHCKSGNVSRQSWTWNVPMFLLRVLRRSCLICMVTTKTLNRRGRREIPQRRSWNQDRRVWPPRLVSLLWAQDRTLQGRFQVWMSQVGNRRLTCHSRPGLIEVEIAERLAGVGRFLGFADRYLKLLLQHVGGIFL